MEQMRTKKWGSCITIIFILFILTYNKLHTFYDTADVGHNGLYLLFLVSIILFSGLNLVKTSFEKIFYIFFILCIPSIFLYSNGLQSILINASTILSPLCGFVLGKLVYNWIEGTNHKDALLFFFLIPLVYCIVFILFDSSVPINERRDATFLLCCYIPFVLLLISKIKYLLISLLGIIIVISAKRSSIIFMGIIVFALILGGITKTKHKILKLVEICTVLCIVGYGFIIWYDVDYVSMLSSFDRFGEMAEDGGSGRTGHYSDILLSFVNSDLFFQLFGHGSNAVSNTFGIPAHNDFLEVLYDFGVFAVISFVVFWANIIITDIKYFKKKWIPNSEYYLSISVILGYLTLINLNCFITNPLYYILMFSYIGYFQTKIRQKEMQYA